MKAITAATIAATSDDEHLFSLLGEELERHLPNGRSASGGFVEELKRLPPGLRAMAATYELDVSLALEDLGWHFGQWHHLELAEETAAGLVELGAEDLASVFREALWRARKVWDKLAQPNWSEWYDRSPLQQELAPLNERAWALWREQPMGIFSFWITYARRHPERLEDTAANDA